MSMVLIEQHSVLVK